MTKEANLVALGAAGRGRIAAPCRDRSSRGCTVRRRWNEHHLYGNGHDVYSVSLDGSSPRKLLHGRQLLLLPFRFSPDARIFRFSQFDSQIDS